MRPDYEKCWVSSWNLDLIEVGGVKVFEQRTNLVKMVLKKEALTGDNTDRLMDK